MWSRRHWSFEIIKSNKLAWRFFRFPYPVQLFGRSVDELMLCCSFDGWKGHAVVHENQWNWNFDVENFDFFCSRSFWKLVVKHFCAVTKDCSPLFPRSPGLKRFQKFRPCLGNHLTLMSKYSPSSFGIIPNFWGKKTKKIWSAGTRVNSPACADSKQICSW